MTRISRFDQWGKADAGMGLLWRSSATRRSEYPTFSGAYMEHYRVRNTDPLTSFEAADSIENIVDKHYQIILDCLSKHGPLGKDGIANKTTLIGYQVGKRLTELERMNLIEQTGKNVKSTSGRSEREWKIKPTQLTLV